MKPVYALVLILVAAGAMLLLRRDEANTASFPIEQPTDERQLVPRTKIDADTSSGPKNINGNPTPKIRTLVQDCIEFPKEEVEVVAPGEAAVAQDTVAMGNQMLAYLNIERSTVEDYALQGDSAAMVVLSRIEANAAYGIAGAILTKQERKNASRRSTTVTKEESETHVENSLRWLYLAALHGRLEALPLYGHGMAASGMDAVKLGWVSQEQYDSLSESERDALQPRKVYRRLLYDLTPEFLESHRRDTWSAAKYPDTELITSIVDTLRRDYFRDLELKYLPVPHTVGARYPKYLEIMDNACNQPKF